MTDSDAFEPLHLVVEFGKHAPDLPIETLGQNHAESSSRIEFHGLGFCEAFLQVDSIEKTLCVIRVEHSVEMDFILLLDVIAGMGELLGQLARRSNEQQAGAVVIESAHVVQGAEFFREQVVDRIPAFGIIFRADVADGLVQNESEIGFPAKKAAIEFDVVVVTDTSAKIGDDFTVDFDATFEDESFALAP